MTGEQQHEKGRQGALFAKRWLNSTARVRIQWTAYDDLPAYVQLPQLNGEPEGFDLAGHLVDNDGSAGRPLYVEVKNYDHEGNQGIRYLDFLAKCYSVTAEARQSGVDKETHFMWLTWHPFSVSKWSKLTTPELILEALVDDDRKDKYLGLNEVDDAIAAAAAERVFLVVLSRRHDQLMVPQWLLEGMASLVERRQLA